MLPESTVAKDFFVYDLDFASIAAGASASGSINIQADSDFQVQKLTYMADLVGAAQTDGSRVIPLMTILITDSGSGRQLMDRAVPVPAIFGTGEIPFILPQPKIFIARSTVTVAIANYSAATPYLLRLAFIGTKIFRR